MVIVGVPYTESELSGTRGDPIRSKPCGRYGWRPPASRGRAPAVPGARRRLAQGPQLARQRSSWRPGDRRVVVPRHVQRCTVLAFQFPGFPRPSARPTSPITRASRGPDAIWRSTRTM
jgi:hypothetical protein